MLGTGATFHIRCFCRQWNITKLLQNFYKKEGDRKLQVGFLFVLSILRFECVFSSDKGGVAMPSRIKKAFICFSCWKMNIKNIEQEKVEVLYFSQLVVLPLDKGYNKVRKLMFSLSIFCLFPLMKQTHCVCVLKFLFSAWKAATSLRLKVCCSFFG